MKTPSHSRILYPTFIRVLSVLILLCSPALAQAQSSKVSARPLTPQEITDYGLEGVYPSGGLLTVGIGEPVYLEALVDSGTVVTGVTWSIEQRPLGAPPSVANLEDSPLPGDMPIFSPGDRQFLEVAGRKLFVPDVTGLYKVQAVVNTDGGPVVLEANVTGAMYTGVGIMGEASPAYPQCALCHEENAIGWGETGHATFFEWAIDGDASDHYSESCIDCHVLGGHVPDAPNGNFAQTASQLGWTFPAVLEPGNWDAMPAELQAKASIQCESCHGAGSEHHGDINTISLSYNAGDCGQCHDSGTHHVKNREWNLSTHARVTTRPTGEGRESCVRCHSAIGFVETLDGVAEVNTDYEAITCSACHDPHNGEHHGQLRTMADVTLENDAVVTEGGAGKLCMTCHKGRRNAEEYVQGSVSSHFGPHYGVQGDMFNGTNAIEYGKDIGGASGHLYALENSCADCHMQAVDSDSPALFEAGGHTFKVAWDAGTPEDHSDDVDMVGSCADCHGPLDSFDDFKGDYNLDGFAEPIQTEVEHLLHALAMKLPPLGEPVMQIDTDYEYSDAEKKALYNYLCAEEDGSHGMHNPRYITGILKGSIEDLSDPFNSVLGGQNIPVGGEWFYSSWFKFYSPLDVDGWVYHYEHGHLYIIPGADGSIWYWEDRTGNWRYTSPSTYPSIFDPQGNTWLYYAGTRKFNRMFYSFATGEWMLFE